MQKVNNVGGGMVYYGHKCEGTDALFAYNKHGLIQSVFPISNYSLLAKWYWHCALYVWHSPEKQ